MCRGYGWGGRNVSWIWLGRTQCVVDMAGADAMCRGYGWGGRNVSWIWLGRTQCVVDMAGADAMCRGYDTSELSEVSFVVVH